MKENIKIVASLFIVVVASLAAVFAVEAFTTPIINAQTFASVEEAKESIFSNYTNASFTAICSQEYENSYYDNLDITSVCDFDDISPDLNDYNIVEVTEVKRSGSVVGYAYWAEAPGYAGTISYVVGIATDDAETVLGLEIISHSETPGLGSLIENEEFTGDFENISAAEVEAGVDGVTSATPTITNQAMQGSVNSVIAFYRLTTQGIPDPAGIPLTDLEALLTQVGYGGATGASVYQSLYEDDSSLYVSEIWDIYEIRDGADVVGYVYYVNFVGNGSKSIKLDYFIDVDGNALDFRFRSDSYDQTWNDAAGTYGNYDGSQGTDFESSPWLDLFRNTTVSALSNLNPSTSADAVAGVTATTAPMINVMKTVAEYHMEVFM